MKLTNLRAVYCLLLVTAMTCIWACTKRSPEGDEEANRDAELKVSTESGVDIYSEKTAYERVLQIVKSDVGVPAEMHRLFPETDSSLSRFTSRDRGPIPWIGTVTIYGRYVLEISVPVDVSDNDTSVAQSGEAVFSLLEVSRVEASNAGTINVEFGRHESFGIDDWRSVVRNQGAIENVFSDIITDHPVEGINYYVDDLRRRGQ